MTVVMLLAQVDWEAGLKGGLRGGLIGAAVGVVIALVLWPIRRGKGPH